MPSNIIFLIPIFAIIGGISLSAYKMYLKSKSDNKEHKSVDALEQQIAVLSQQVTELKQRTVVLEKIVTTENYDLKEQINSL